MKTTLNDFTASKGEPSSAPAFGDSAAESQRNQVHDSVGPVSLLISVRTEQEVGAAIDGGADIVDLKEPRRGSLAPTSAHVWQRAISAFDDRQGIRLSAALGESDEAVLAAAALPKAFHFAKAGPSRCDSKEALYQLWSSVQARMGDSIELVAVAYADHRAAGCLPASMVFAAAADFGLRRCLIDTFVKDGRTTVDHLEMAGLQQLANVASERTLWWAVAGSMRIKHVDQLHRYGIAPSCWGVRGDVCDHGRSGKLVPSRVYQWKQALQKAVGCQRI